MFCLYYVWLLFWSTCRQSPPPEDRTLYADPNTIPHEAAPDTGAEYAMVDMGNKKKKKKQPDPSPGLYQVIRPGSVVGATACT